MNSYQSIDWFHRKLSDISALFSRAGISIVEYRYYGNVVDVVIESPLGRDVFEELYRRLIEDHGILVFHLRLDRPVLRFLPYVTKSSRLEKYRWISTSLAVVTIFFTGLGLSESLYSVLGKIHGVFYDQFRVYLEASIYTAIFLVTLLSHEIGHLVASRRGYLKTTGPILIPAPPIQLGFIGTLGAVIFTKTPPASRRDLARLGLLGPLMGIIVATLIGILGVYISPLIRPDVVEELVETGEIQPIDMASLGFYLILLLRRGNGVILLHPILFVSYVVYIVTFLNLLPIGQLDGGHVVRSVMSDKAYRLISSMIPLIFITTGAALIYMGISTYYLISLGVLSLIIYLAMGRRGHPGVVNQYDESRHWLYFTIYILLVILTTPIPLT